MANIKEVEIRGSLPFDCGEDDDMLRLLGQLNTPTCGLRIDWAPSPTRYEPNEHGGRTAIYVFLIHGQEAASWDYLYGVVRTIQAAGGNVAQAKARDVEDGGRWESLGHSWLGSKCRAGR
jgi:hypothetical protein